MRVQFQTEGGIAYFPGLATPQTIDVEALDDQARRELVELIDKAKFFDLPRELPAAPGAADFQTNVVTIEDGERRHTVRVSDASGHPELQTLIARLRSLAASQRRR
jgi:hypothetical protein